MKPLQRLKELFQKAISLWVSQREVRRKIDEAKILGAKSLINQLISRENITHIAETEFKVFSQFGDDGIIQYLVHQIKPENHVFVEFGVQDYTESNTRFLLINNNWRGLVMDGSASNIAYIKSDEIYWQHDFVAMHAWIDRNNINTLLQQNGFIGDIGLLSIDIDGNDYWVWEQINVVKPVVVVAEYNSVFGSKFALTIPYDPEFHRTKAHYSNLYWGCSLRSLELLAKKKGYSLIGSNSAGNNAYFVRNDKLGKLKPVNAEEAYILSKYRESRDKEGKLTYLSGIDRAHLIANMPVYDIESGKIGQLKEYIGK